VGAGLALLSSDENRLFGYNRGWRKMNDTVGKINCNDLITKSVLAPNAIDPREGVRLIKAFLEIKEQGLRETLIRLAEDIAKATS
jgi:hypothetical protein